jgi:hypothetical protein
MATDPATSIKTRVGEFFRSNLDMDEIHFFQNNADSDAAPPYGVVTITKMEETTPQSHVFTAEVKVAVVTSIDISSSEQHDILLELVQDKLAAIPRRTTDVTIGIRIFGWVELYSETVTKDESQSFSDVITIRCGCGG